MARNAAQAVTRRRALLQALRRGEAISTSAMAERLGVSAMTIRRDLRALEESGAALRSYGGAVAAQRVTFEFQFDERRRRHRDAKRRIGEAAAELVEPGNTVFLDTGTTTLEVARALARRDVECLVATSSLVVASELWGRGRAELLLLGGRVRRGNPDLVGPATELMLDRLTGDIAFVGTDALDPTRGSFAEDMGAARVAERMAGHAGRVVVVADSSKLGLAAPFMCVPVDDIDDLVTDAGASDESAGALADRGVRTIKV
jgi:DeoR/GlpR family transcriptional regulator of sugar metabolism